MTDILLTLRRPNRLVQLLQRLLDWLAEPVSVVESRPTFSAREWADLPVHHPIRDDKGGR